MRQAKAILICICLVCTISCTHNQSRTNIPTTNVADNKTDSSAVLVRDSGVNASVDTIIDPMSDEGFGDLIIGLKYQQVLTKYGKPDKQTKAEIWGADGEYHQKVFYTTKGIEFDIIGDTIDKKTVNMITITSPSVLKTKRGIGIGSNIDDVMKSYRASIDSEASTDDYIVVGTIYGGLIIHFKKKLVTSMYLGAAAV